MGNPAAASTSRVHDSPGDSVRPSAIATTRAATRRPRPSRATPSAAFSSSRVNPPARAASAATTPARIPALAAHWTTATAGETAGVPPTSTTTFGGRAACTWSRSSDRHFPGPTSDTCTFPRSERSTGSPWSATALRWLTAYPLPSRPAMARAVMTCRVTGSAAPNRRPSTYIPPRTRTSRRDGPSGPQRGGRRNCKSSAVERNPRAASAAATRSSMPPSLATPALIRRGSHSSLWTAGRPAQTLWTTGTGAGRWST